MLASQPGSFLKSKLCNSHNKERDAAAPKTVNIVVGFVWIVNAQMGTGSWGYHSRSCTVVC